jgi:transporter family-2 protein
VLIVYIFMGLLAGAVMPAQAGINYKLRTFLGDPVLAAFVSFVVGTLALAALALAQRTPLPAWQDVARSPWWVWIGGFMGAYVVGSSVVLAPRLGATAMLALIVAGQMLASIVIDHFGWFGYRVDPVNLRRVLGTLLLVAGVWLVVSARRAT